jgi:hypothetical protein
MKSLKGQFKKSYQVILKQIKGRVISNQRRKDVIDDIYQVLLELQNQNALHEPIVFDPKTYAESIVLSLDPTRIPFLGIKLTKWIVGALVISTLIWTMDRYLIKETLDTPEISFDRNQALLIWDDVPGAKSYQVLVNNILVAEIEDTIFSPSIHDYEISYTFQVKSIPVKSFDLPSISKPVTYQPDQIISTLQPGTYTQFEDEAYYEMFQTADIHGNIFFEFIPWFDGNMTFKLQNLSTDQPIQSFDISINGEIPTTFQETDGIKSFHVMTNSRYLFMIRSVDMNQDVSLQIKAETTYDSRMIPEMTIEGESTSSYWIRFDMINYAFYDYSKTAEEIEISFYTLHRVQISMDIHSHLMEVSKFGISSYPIFLVMVIHNPTVIDQTLSLIPVEFDVFALNEDIILATDKMTFLHRIDISGSSGSLRIEYDFDDQFHILNMRDENMFLINAQVISYGNSTVFLFDTSSRYLHLIWYLSPNSTSQDPIHPSYYQVND